MTVRDPDCRAYARRVVIEVREHIALGVKEKHAVVAVPTPKPAPGTAFPPRRLILKGRPAFDLNLWCGTCPALFKKLSEPEVADLGLTNEQLNVGLTQIDDVALRAYGKLLPQSTYTVLLLEIRPRLVEPGSSLDYFTHEQVVTWGLDDSGAADDPGTPYYRTFETKLGTDRHLYEFVVPMVPPTWNDPGRVNAYLETGGTESGTAVAYSLFDVLQPAMDEGEDYYEHWVLTHFLLDGHHKVEAAARTERPVRLLSVVDERISIASPEDLEAMVRARSPRTARR
jgi:hypothetical protein